MDAITSRAIQHIVGWITPPYSTQKSCAARAVAEKLKKSLPAAKKTTMEPQIYMDTDVMPTLILHTNVGICC